MELPVTRADLARTLGEGTAPLDDLMADWALETVVFEAVEITGREEWLEVGSEVPPAVINTLILSARRLYTNPDRFVRESEGGYSYGLDDSVTSADIFTPAEEKRLLRHAIPEIQAERRQLHVFDSVRSHDPRWL